VQFIIITELFARYDLVVTPGTYQTDVYCRDCEKWVATYRGDEIQTLDSGELLEKILLDHSADFPTMVEFSDETVTFK